MLRDMAAFFKKLKGYEKSIFKIPKPVGSGFENWILEFI